MKAVAREKGARWEVVLCADAAPADSPDGRNLRALVTLALPKVEAALPPSARPLLLTHPGLVVRYGQLGFLDRLRDRVTRPDGGLAGAWLLLPADG